MVASCLYIYIIIMYNIVEAHCHIVELTSSGGGGGGVKKPPRPKHSAAHNWPYPHCSIILGYSAGACTVLLK